MMAEMSKSAAVYIALRILDNAKDAFQEFTENAGDAFAGAKMKAYVDILEAAGINSVYAQHIDLAALRKIISILLPRAKEVFAQARANRADTVKSAEDLAYYEVLDTIQNELIAHEQNLRDFDLDMDLDEAS